MKHVNRTITILVFIFLYIPMIVLAVASFNTGTDIASFKGFTLGQYVNLFRDRTLLALLGLCLHRRRNARACGARKGDTMQIYDEANALARWPPSASMA